jgi:hypothetical protein
MSLLKIFRLIAPEFDSLPDLKICEHLELAALDVSNSLLSKEMREKMIAYLTAHYLTISHKRNGAGGEVVAVSEGKLSIQYASGYSVVKSDLAATGYGKIYDRLMRSHTIPVMTRVI